ncbi:Lar family restriction alleviation protein [Brevundimonas diminuta]|uniref:Restriction alleviation protein, Lar family n=1 Tax=Brevundimonas diminuta TaxID=293 RepID=A0A2X1AUN1_BREDI|nr:Lar family restriction alleviation protein [Brevundimonas diminuta]SPU44282.1 restriction alleviation protein, Lar family [Brevundimonas diminuta]
MAETKCKRGFQSHVMCDCEPTHPLTPREKLKPCPFCGGEAMFEAEHPMYEGRMFVGCKDCCAEAEPLASDQYTKAEQAEAWNRRTALASGSGDHAELARLKAAMSKSNDEICQSLGKALGYPWFKDDQRNFPGATEENGVCVGEHVAESIADEAASRISALLAENAALRSNLTKTERDYTELRDSYDAIVNKLGIERAHGSRETKRATEAERNLAEAVGLLEEILPPVLCGESWDLPDDDVSHQRMSFGWVKKARTFLSKEAERG